MSLTLNAMRGELARKLGWKVHRGPAQDSAKLMLEQIAAYLPAPDAQAMVNEVSGQLASLYEEADDQKREKQNADWWALKDVVAGRIQLLADTKKQEKGAKAANSDGAEQAATAKLRKSLEAELDANVKTMSPRLGEIMTPDPVLAASELRGRAESLRLSIRGDDLSKNLGGMTREDDLRRRMAALNVAIDAANMRAQADLDELDRIASSDMVRITAKLAAFDRLVRGNYQGQLRTSGALLQSMLTGRPKNYTAILAQLQRALADLAAIADEPDRIQSTHAIAVNVNNGAAIQQFFAEKAAKISPMLLHLLKEHAPEYGALEQRMEALRKASATPTPDDQIDAVKQKIECDLADLELILEAARDKARVALTGLGDAVRIKLADANTRLAKVKSDLTGVAASDADLKVIDAQLGAARVTIPAAGAYPATMNGADVNLATKLADAILAQIGGLEVGHDKLRAFDTDMKEVAEQLHTRTFFERIRGGSRELLEKYDPTKQAEFDKKMTALADALPKLLSAEALKRLDKLKSDIQATIDIVQAAVDYMLTAKQTYNSTNDRLISINHDWREEDSDLKAKMLSLKAQFDLTPPSLATLRAAEQAVTDAGAKITTNTDLLNDISATKDAAETAQTKAHDDTVMYQKWMRPILALMQSATLMVNSVAGDRNALQSAERIRDDIDAAIKGGAFGPALDVKIGTLRQRLKLLIANPVGEANRRLDELPKLLELLAVAASEAQKGLQDTSGEISRHPTNDADEIEQCNTAVALLTAFGTNISERVAPLRIAVNPIADPQRFGTDARLKAREESLRLLRSYRDLIRKHPLSTNLLTSPFAAAKAALAPVFSSLDQLEYTLSTCIS